MHNLPYVIQTGNYNISAISLRNISMEQIHDLMAKLSSQHQQEVLDFAQYLAEKKANLNAKSYGSTGWADWPSSTGVILLRNCN